MRVEHVVVWGTGVVGHLYNWSWCLNNDCGSYWDAGGDWNGSNALTDICDAIDEDTAICARDVGVDMRTSGGVTNLRLEILFGGSHCGVQLIDLAL